MITGASSGMGRAAALMFAREGANVAVVGRSRQRVHETADEIGDQALPMTTDVRDARAIAGVFEAAVERRGGINVVFNNAGGGDAGMREVHAYTEAEFDDFISINLRDVWLGMKYGIPLLREAGGGSIISTSSIGAITGINGTAAYAAAKSGIHALTRTAAAENAQHNIRVNCIVPGAVMSRLGLPSDSEQTEEDIQARRERGARNSPIGRGGVGDDIAYLAVFLASDESEFITGQLIVADGGWTAIDARTNPRAGHGG